ncbi:unnamed protein product [Cochlearia groenlandica]
MGKPTTQNINFINHFSHPHPLQLTPAASSPPCFACKFAGGNSRIYSCRPCNFSLHESCSKMKQVIKHPSHPSHTLSLLVAPVYDGGYFSCDGCGIIGTGFSYQCSHCDFDIHALCAYKPLSVVHNSHPQHSLKLAFQSPYGANKGFSCDICGKIGKNQWLYRCIPCEFDAHVGCITPPQPHFLQHSASAPHPNIHQNPLPMPNQGNSMPITRPMRRPNMPMTRPNRPMVQNNMTYGPRIQNNNLGYNGAIGYGRGRGNPNMNQGAYNTQPRAMGQRVQYGPNGGANRMNGGLNAPNGLGNTLVNTMVQSLCQGFATNMLGGGGGGGDVNGGGGDIGGSSILGGFLGGDT